MYKYELHCHDNIASRCEEYAVTKLYKCVSSVEELIAEFKGGRVRLALLKENKVQNRDETKT